MTHALHYYRDLVRVLLTKELKLRYKFTVLGYVWSVLHPLAFALVYYVVISNFMGARGLRFLEIIVVMFPWQWFQNSVTASNNFFLGNWMLIKKVRFPRSTLVLAGVLNDTVHFVASVPIIVIFLLMSGHLPAWSWLGLIPLLVVVQFAFTFGLALLIGTLNLFFRDLERITAIVTMLWFFVTPILYPASRIPAHLEWVLYCNPFGPLAECWRQAFLHGTMPLDLAGLAAGYAALVAWIGYRVYRHYEWRFAEIV